MHSYKRIDFMNPEAADYAARVEKLGSRIAIQPTIELAYGPDFGQRLDVYAPPKARDLPILVFFHGGAWVNGKRSWLKFMVPNLLELPAVFVAGTYRLAPRCRWPAQYEDVRDALHCVVHNADRIGGNPARLVVGGHSAGAHLASLVALKGESPPLLAAFPVSSPYDLQYGNVPLESETGRVYKYLLQDPKQDFEASPINFVAGNTVPFHVTWGERDFERIRRSTVRFIKAMQSQPGPITFAEQPHASHFDCHLELADAHNPWYRELNRAMRAPAR